MKKLVLLSLALMLSLTELFAARMLPTRGRVVDEQGNAVAYATVVLLRDEKQVAGMASDEEGRFELRVPAGKYHLRIQYVGYEPIDRDVQLAADGELGNLTLRTAATQIEGVTVKAQLIRREADRFVVDVANTPSAIGRDGVELLEQAPGVWVSDDKISINGKSGSKVFINDRELRMEPEQLLTYLRSLRAEEIQKIEVVPVTGADYDADSSGGVIKITLRKRRENGLNGSVSMRTTQGKMGSSYMPAANISIHSGRFDINASAWASFGPSEVLSTEKTDYTTSSKRLNAESTMKNDDTSGGGRLGAIYEINDRHSVGAEFSYLRMTESGTTQTHSMMGNGTTSETDSRFRPTSTTNGYEGTFNYIWKIDTLGSQFKVLGDYARREASSHNDNFSHIQPEGLPSVDSTYRDHTDNSFEVAALTLALDKKFSPKWSLQTGAKYTRNHTYNNSLYQYLKEEEWVRNDDQSLRVDYTEHIAAAYGVVTAKLGRWGVTAGLRGEYTRTDGRRNGVEQNYFSLFPNANVSYSLSRDGAYSLVAQYARTIRRPSFWTLMPNRSRPAPQLHERREPHGGARPQVHADGRHQHRRRRNQPGHGSRRRESRRAGHPLAQLRPHVELLPGRKPSVPARQMVDAQPQRQLHLQRHAPLEPRLNPVPPLPLRQRADHLHAAGQGLPRPLVPLQQPALSGFVLGRRDALPQRQHQEELLRRPSDLHRLGLQPAEPGADARCARRRLRTPPAGSPELELHPVPGGRNLQLQGGQGLPEEERRGRSRRGPQPPLSRRQTGR